MHSGGRTPCVVSKKTGGWIWHFDKLPKMKSGVKFSRVHLDLFHRALGEGSRKQRIPMKLLEHFRFRLLRKIHLKKGLAKIWNLIGFSRNFAETRITKFSLQ